MRKCTSFPSLVVLKHIHMFPFVLLPLPPLPCCNFHLLFLFFSMKNGFCVKMNDTTHCSGVFLLLSCCWLCRLTVGKIQFGVLQCVKDISAGPELLVEPCANRGSRSLSASHRLEHTNLGRPSIVCGPGFFFSSFLFLHVCLRISFPPRSLSPCFRKPICFKTRAKYYHIYIFLFQEGSKESVWCGLFFFFSVERSQPGVRLCLKP